MHVLLSLILISFLVILCETKMEPFVVEGISANIADFPHCVYLAIDCANQWICGASILNQDILITAAHCVIACDMENENHLIEAYVGHENLLKVKSTREITEIKCHEDYNPKTSSNDIALVALQKSLYLGNNVKRIVLSRHYPNVERGLVAGWGILNDETEETKFKLKFAEQKIRSKRVCSQVGILDEGMFCAGSTKEQGRHPADGDSGSGLVSKDYTILGIVSFRVRRLPALMVYTNVSYYYDWVTENAGLLYCQSLRKKIARTKK